MKEKYLYLRIVWKNYNGTDEEHNTTCMIIPESMYQEAVSILPMNEVVIFDVQECDDTEGLIRRLSRIYHSYYENNNPFSEYLKSSDNDVALCEEEKND